MTATVTDRGGLTDTLTQQVAIANLPPEITGVDWSKPEEGQNTSLWATATDPGGDPLAFAWDFGDGTTAYGETVEHRWATSGTYTLTLTVTDESEAADVSVHAIVVDNLPPAIEALDLPDDAAEGQPAMLTASASDPGDDPLTYVWDLGDGTSATGAAVAHTWAHSGTYTVTLTVTDDEGASDARAGTVHVANLPPVLLALERPDATEGAPVIYEGTAMDPGDDAFTWTWTFGDGAVYEDAGPLVEHTWLGSGAWDLEIVLTDEEGAISTWTFTVEVANDAPSFASLDLPAEGDEGETLRFAVEVDDPGAIDVPELIVTWTFGDGATATGTEVEHAYANDGLYPLVVVVTDPDGATAEYTTVVRVHNVAPVFVRPMQPRAVLEGALYTWTPEIYDPGADVMNFGFLEAPAGATLDPTTGTIVWTPTHAQAKQVWARFGLRVDDGDGGEAFTRWYVSIELRDDAGNGLPDTWEITNGLDPAETDGDADPDGDGRTNLQEFLDGTDPLVYDGPGAPVAAAPYDGDVVTTASPRLTWHPAPHPHGDPLTYEIEVYADAALTLIVARGVSDDTAWRVSPPLAEAAPTWWRVRASDAYVAGAWSEPEWFTVEVAPGAPTLPAALYPVDEELLPSSAATLQWAASVAPDGAPVWYDVEVRTPHGRLVAEAFGLEDPGTLDVRWSVDATLTAGERYVWRVRAVTDAASASGWSAESAFRVTEDAPLTVGAPVWTSPRCGDRVDDTSPHLALAAPHSLATVSYLVEVSTDPTFDTIAHDKVLWALGGWLRWDLATDGLALDDRTDWFARVQARSDDDLGAPWELTCFRVGPPDVAPTTPTLMSPAHESLIQGDAIRLVLGNSADEDDDAITYDIVVHDAFGAFVAGVEALEESATGTTRWELPHHLEVGLYTWTARAVDATGLASDWATAQPFEIEKAAPASDLVPRGGGLSCDTTSTPVGGAWLLVLALATLRRRR